MKQHNATYTTLSLLLLFVCLIAINGAAYFLPLRADLTEEKLYTISDGTRKILSELEEPVTAKFYFRKSSEEVPPSIKVYAQRVQELFQEYSRISDGMLKVQVLDPQPDTEEEEWAQKYGISAVPLPTGNTFYFGAVLISLDQEEVIPVFDPRRQSFLEYDISQALLKVSQAQAMEVGILSHFPVGGMEIPPQLGGFGGQGSPEWALSLELKKTFDVSVLDASVTSIPEDIQILLLIHPKNLKPAALYAIDQYVLRGGRLMVFVDPSSREELAKTPPQQGQMPQVSSDLKQLFISWGIDYEPTKLVGDLEVAAQVNTGPSGVLRYPIWMNMNAQNINKEHPVTSQLESLLIVEGGSLKLLDGTPHEFTPLVQTTKDSGEIEGFMAHFGSPASVAKALKPDQQQRTIAALIQGNFTSAFPDGPPAADDESESTSTSNSSNSEHLSRGSAKNTIFVMADTDFLSDPFSVQRLNFLGQRLIQPTNDNLNLVLNTVEFLSGNDALMSIRSRGTFSRPFTRLIEIQKQAQLKYQEEEQQLQQKLSEVQKRLEQFAQVQGNQKRIILGSEQQSEIKAFREEERQTRKRLREVRKVLRQDIEQLGNVLLTLNLLVIPFLTAVVGIVIYTRRMRRS